MEASEGRPLIPFLLSFALAYLAAALLPSGVMHLGRLRHFGRLLFTHGIVPPVLIGPVAVMVGVLETGIGLLALLALAGVRPQVSLPALLGGAAVLGAGFFLYLTTLFLRRPDRPVSCGCSLGSSPLAGGSLLPALGLIVVGWLGRAAAAPDTLAAEPAAAPWVLAALWGATVAPVVAMLPAALPGAAEARS